MNGGELESAIGPFQPVASIELASAACDWAGRRVAVLLTPHDLITAVTLSKRSLAVSCTF